MSSTRPVTIAPSRSPSSRPGPAGGKRDENRQRRTRALGEAALGLFLARGIEAVTIDDIVEEAGTAKGSFYRYFADKTALVEALVAPVGTTVRAAFASAAEALEQTSDNAGLPSVYRGIAMALASVVLEHPDAVRLYLQECRAPGTGARAPIAVLAKDIHKGTVDLAQMARVHKLVRDIPAAIVATSVQGACEALVWRVLAGEELAPLDEIPDALIGIILDGMRGATGPLAKPAEKPVEKEKPAEKPATEKPVEQAEPEKPAPAAKKKR